MNLNRMIDAVYERKIRDQLAVLEKGRSIDATIIVAKVEVADSGLNISELLKIKT